MSQESGTAYTRTLLVDAIENLVALTNSGEIKNPRALINLSHAMCDIDDALQVVSYGDEPVPRYIAESMMSPRHASKVPATIQRAEQTIKHQSQAPAQPTAVTEQPKPVAPVREVKRPQRQMWVPPQFDDIQRDAFDPETNRQTMININENYGRNHNDYLSEFGQSTYTPTEYDNIPKEVPSTGDFPPYNDEDNFYDESAAYGIETPDDWEPNKAPFEDGTIDFSDMEPPSDDDIPFETMIAEDEDYDPAFYNDDYLNEVNEEEEVTEETSEFSYTPEIDLDKDADEVDGLLNMDDDNYADPIKRNSKQ